jgi:predicted permease
MSKLNSRKGTHPHRWAERLLEWLAAPHLLEEVQGDLQELFEIRLQTYSLRKARWLYVLDLLNLIHPRLWRKKPSSYSALNTIDMFNHFLVLSFRTFKRSKGSFFINLIGLSTGLACTLLIYLWVKDELAVDKFHEKDSQLYQVMEHTKQADGILTSTSTSGRMGESLVKEMPEVEYAATVRAMDQVVTLTVGETHLKATGRYVSNDFFKVFSYGFVQGNEQVLKDKNSIVISESLANSLFNTTQDIIGKSIEFGHEKQFLVSGIMKDMPANSSEKFDFVLSFEGFSENNDWVLDWNNEAVATYVILKPGTNIEAFNSKIADFIKLKKNDPNSHRTPFVTRYSEYYLYGKYENGIQAGGRIEYVKLFSSIAVFILLIACINFMNLSTAKATRRIKEVGIKKAVGADRKALIFQFLTESLLISLLSVLVALILVFILLPEFNEITAKNLGLPFDSNLIVSLLGITLFTGILAGSYPALYLSAFRPAMILKGKMNSSLSEVWVRKVLVVFQFALSIILIVTVMVVYKQTEFVQTKNLGYNRDNIIYFDREGQTKEDLETFLSEIRNIPGVVNASSMGHDLTGHSWGVYGFDWEGKDPNDKTSFEMAVIYYEMMETLGIQMKEGRTFSKSFGADSAKVVFNEAAIAHMGLKNPIGKTIKFWGKDYQIIGVAKNFHFESLHENIKPLIFRLWPERTNKFMVKLQAGREKETISRLEEFYTNYNPGFSFDYKFLDEEYGAQYEAEKRVSLLSRYFAGLAVLISCLGLFGLAAFTAQRRRKEIGIRKVLGSSEWSIVQLLSGEFTKLVLISILIALPLSHLLTKEWLSNFAFSIEVKWWYYVGAGLLALLIATFTVGAQAIRASQINPIQTLREE